MSDIATRFEAWSPRPDSDVRNKIQCRGRTDMKTTTTHRAVLLAMMACGLTLTCLEVERE